MEFRGNIIIRTVDGKTVATYNNATLNFFDNGFCVQSRTTRAHFYSDKYLWEVEE